MDLFDLPPLDDDDPPPLDDIPPKKTTPLAAHHLKHLRTSGLSDKTIAAAKIFTVADPAAAAGFLNWQGTDGPAPAIAFPYFVRGGICDGAVLRPDAPHVKSDGKVAKYLWPKEKPARPYFPPPSLTAIAAYEDPTQPLLLTEGIKKILAVVQAGMIGISAQGTTTWHNTKEKAHKLHLDLAGIPLQGRKVFIAFDGGDTTANPPVIHAEARLARMLLDAGAIVRLLRIPSPNGGKVGIDDYLTVQLDARLALAWLLDDAIPADPIERAQVAVASNGHALAATQKLVADLSFAYAWGESSDAVRDGICSVLKGHISRKALGAMGKAAKAQLAPTGKVPPTPKAPQVLSPGALPPIPVAEVFTMARTASDVERARHIRSTLGHVVAAEGALWRRSGVIWKRVPDAEIHTSVCALDGQVFNHNEVTLKASNIRDLCRLVVDIDRDNDFFVNAPSGVAVGDEFVAVGPAGLSREELQLEHRARWRIDADLGELDTQPTKWLALLQDILADEHGKPIAGRQEVIDAIGETLGLALIGQGATRDARHLLLRGAPSSGKSTLLEIFGSLVPAEAQTALTLHDLQFQFRVAALIGVRLVLCAELPARDLLDVEKAKAVLTGDPVLAERKFHDPTTLRPMAGWIVCANGLPAAPDASLAMFRRFLLVELHRSFTITSQDFAAPILATERGAIVGWALRLAAASLARGARTVPAECLQAAGEWSKDSDPFTAWFAARVVRDATARTPREAAWKDYESWVKYRGGKPLSFMSFRRQLGSAGVRGTPGKGNGLPLRLSTDDDPLAWGPIGV